MIEKIYEEVQDSIRYAKRIQKAILPSGELINTCLPENFVLYKPKDIVAGDFYWLESIAKATDTDGEGVEKVLFAVADCTGHGVPGAMVSVVCNNALNRSVREYGLTDPGRILDKTREIVIEEFEKSADEVKDGMDISLCSLQFNFEGSQKRSEGTATLKWAGANNPLWIVRNRELIELKPDKQPIGKFAASVPFTTHEIELRHGDCLYLFSDGYADQFGGEKGKKFKSANLKQLLLSLQSESMGRQKELIDEVFEKWRGRLEQIDDVCVIGVKV